MRRLRNWLARLGMQSEPVRRILSRATDAIREANIISRTQDDTELAAEINMERIRLRSRMDEVILLRQAELACIAPDRARELSEAWGPLPADNVAQFKERLWELELALEDRGWQREQALAMLEFSRYGVGQLIRIARIYSLKNPLIKRISEIVAQYVMGRGIEIRSEDETEDAVIQDFLKRNTAELDHTGLAQKCQSEQIDGSLFFGLKTSTQVDIQMVDPLEIMDVVTDPDDTSKDWYYRRQWARMEFTPAGGQHPVPMEAWYPSLWMARNGTDKPPAIEGKPVNWDMPIYRVKLGCPPKWRWGIPPVYASIDWARAYKDFLEDWATVNRTLARFALLVETKGGPGAIAAYHSYFSTTFGDSDGTQIERNPPPTVASAHISGPDDKISAFRSAGSHTSPEQARRLLLMVAAASGQPETFFGDASTGSLATAVSLDRPTELKFKEIQQRWIATLTTILEYVLEVDSQNPLSRMREARASNPAPQPWQLHLKFPAVLEHDVAVMVEAWAHIATLGGRQGIACGIVDRRTVADGMLAEVGMEDRDERLDAMGYGDGYDPKADVTDQRTQAAPQLISGQDANPESTTSDTAPASKKKQAKQEESLAAAVAHLREVVARKNGKN